VVTSGEALPSADAYWLIAPTPQWRQAKVRAMVEFLLSA
jgi:LysR family glycine cleavage system transcriptional activator